MCSDVFIVLDNIQYNKNGHQNRNRIKTPQGPLTLTVPVLDRFAQSLDEVEIDNTQPWARKHWRSIAQHYRKAPYFEVHATWLEGIYQKPWTHLNDLNRALLDAFMLNLKIETPLYYATDMAVPGEATERLVNLVEAVHGTAYLSGAHALDTYLDTEAFAAANIALHIQEWSAPVYPQGNGAFLPELSILDLLMHCGPRAGEVLQGVAP